MSTLRRVNTFTWLTLKDYVRSGRVLIELTLAVAFWGLFFQKYAGFTFSQVFHLGGLFTLLLTLYTTSSMLGLADRAQGYILLTRPLGRRGYLLGIYVAAVLVVWLAFALIIVLTLLVNRPVDFSWRDLLLGGVPTLLNVALLAALMVLISSLVLKNVPRLLLLAALAIALYSNSWPQARSNRILAALQTTFSWLLMPGMKGYQLAETRVYSGGGSAILLAQLAMTVLLLSLALIAFTRRDLILSTRA
ncbi:MAG: hypothetical protein AVDCRST_MAG26-3814 [uncultured Chloroflexia bacterium]|uniref:ABC-2 type transporter domain-containing protein n=1 Tax=uncultured Chloroflexia bacterium TaxID=1672391 RepID=A0A6J4JTK0_9CHLR|nr:MAG: hypothetical protein AVDCRST_MAG26-3814 [uncultured Chloroflexia bacterium]